MSFRIKILFSVIFLSFVVVSIAFSFSFSGFGYPLTSYEKKDNQGQLEETYNWYISLGLGEKSTENSSPSPQPENFKTQATLPGPMT